MRRSLIIANCRIRTVCYWIVETGVGPGGFVIMRGLQSKDRNVEFKRIAVAQPDCGRGREVLHAVVEEHSVISERTV